MAEQVTNSLADPLTSATAQEAVQEPSPLVFYSNYFRRYELLIEFKNLGNPGHCPHGVYVMPAADNLHRTSIGLGSGVLVRLLAAISNHISLLILDISDYKCGSLSFSTQIEP
jgi:hypothetical protein